MVHSPQGDNGAGAAEAAAARLRGWLLSEQVQQREGEHAGGVAGALDENGRARYVYPEITGYYLHWLAEVRDAAGLDEVRVAAARATDWAKRQLERGALQTRSYLIDAPHDWRNDATFFFDLAMLLRGLCAAAEAHLIAPPLLTLQRLVDELDQFVSPDGEIHATRVLRPGTQLPTRWSTIGGAFEVKASSRVILAARYALLPQRLHDACDALAQRYADSPAKIALDMLHPTLYFAEGLLVARPHSAAQVAQLLQRCLALQNPDGTLPEASAGSTLARSDIIAQALRIGLLLQARGIDTLDRAALERLARALVNRVDATGQIPFVPDASPAAQPNVWCGMFAEQALRWYARACSGKPLPAAEWLV
jgi:hypothetical protein